MYGLFAGALAVVTFATPLANIGSPLLMLQRVAHSELSAENAFQQALAMTFVGGAVTGGAILALSEVAFAQFEVLLVIVLCCAEYLFAATVQACSGLAIACGDYRLHASVALVLGSSRMIASLLFMLDPERSPLRFALYYLAGSIAGSIGAVVMSHRTHPVRLRTARFTKRDVTAGLTYAGTAAAWNANDGFDKPLLSKYGPAADPGLYAAAYRVPALALVPIRALATASLNRSFTAGRSGTRAALRATQSALIPCLSYSLIAAGAMLLAAPMATPILGQDFKGSVEIVRWLAFLPVLRTIQLFPGNALMGAGRLKLRFRLLLLATTVNIGGCVALIPHYSWKGAAIATILSESTLAAGLWISVLVPARERASL